MSKPIEIPQPQVLDPDRPLRQRGTQFTEDDRPTDELLHDALRETCSYAAQLWQTLDGIRAYLLDSLPPDPRKPGADRACASPAGPDDEAGWNAWTDAFASVTSVLCGPHGDSGFGRSRAQQEAQLRRTAPVLRTLAGLPPQPAEAIEQPPRAETPQPRAVPEPQPREPSHARANRLNLERAHLALTAVLAVLALRRRRR